MDVEVAGSVVGCQVRFGDFQAMLVTLEVEGPSSVFDRRTKINPRPRPMSTSRENRS